MVRARRSCPREQHIDRKAVKGIGFMEEEQNHAAKGQMVALMQVGQVFQEAVTDAAIAICFKLVPCYPLQEPGEPVPHLGWH